MRNSYIIINVILFNMKPKDEWIVAKVVEDGKILSEHYCDTETEARKFAGKAPGVYFYWKITKMTE